MAPSFDELPLRIRHVKLVGNNRTRPYVVEDQLQVGWCVCRVSVASRSSRHISTRRNWQTHPGRRRYALSTGRYARLQLALCCACGCFWLVVVLLL